VAFFYVNKRLEKNTKSNLKNKFHKNKIKINLKPPIYLLLIIILLWAFLFLGKEDFDIQESFNVLLAKEIKTNIYQSLEQMITFAHQPLHPIVLNILIRLVEFKDWFFILRSLSVIFSILSIYLTYRFTFKIFKNSFISYAATIFLSVQSIFLFYSRRAEPYAILTFLTLLSYYYFWNIFILGSKNKTRIYCLINIVSFFVHYLTLILILSQILAIFLLRRRNLLAVNIFYFLRTVILFAFFIILWYPAIYLSLINNQFAFLDTWSNEAYLSPKSIILVISTIIKLILGLPTIQISILFFIPLLAVIIRLKKENRIFFYIIISLALCVFLYETSALFFLWKNTGRTYFNIRHLVWLIPFISILYGYGLNLVNTSLKLYKKTILGCFFGLILYWNSYLSSKLFLECTNPSYRKALHYVKNQWQNKDLIVWPIGWIDPSIELASEGIFNYRQEKDRIDDITPNGLLKEAKVYERIWVVAPREVYFSVPHVDLEFLNKYISFFKQNFTQHSAWKGNKISVYLFLTHK